MKRGSTASNGHFPFSMKEVAKGLVNRFSRDESGSFATVAGVTAVALFMSVGAVVDYSQISRAKSIMDNSLDSAVLAAGSDLLRKNASNGELRAVFEDHLQANLGGHPKIADIVSIKDFSVDRDEGLISATLSAPIEMAVMGIIGIQHMPVESRAEARFSTTPVEVSMVLDVTGSMNSNGKLNSLKTAATKAVDILLPEGGNNSAVKVGLVPYSEGVRLEGTLAETASGQANRRCMTERRVNKYSDVSHASEYVGVDAQANCSASELKPLTSDGGSLKSEITGLSASGYTAGHLGIAWSYYMLSEKWQDFWQGEAKPDDYGTRTRKIAILMTDGEFNTYFQGVSGNPTGRQKAKSNNDAIGLCRDMKKSKKGGDGIHIYSIAFNAPQSARQTLRNCASEDTAETTYYYDASNQAELEAAFVEIAQSIKALRLSR